MSGDCSHLLKWSPAIFGLGLLFATDLLNPSLTTEQKESLDQVYCQSLTGTTALPRGEEERSWLYSQFEQSQTVAAAVPDDEQSQLRAAILLANFGRNDEAVSRVELLLAQHPASCSAHLILGSIQLYRGNLDQAERPLEAALTLAAEPKDRSVAHLKLGELDLRRQNLTSAEAHFTAAIQDDPQLEATIRALRDSVASPKSSSSSRAASPFADG